MDDDDLRERGEAPPPSSISSASMESARRFLYDEDEPPAGNPANTPVQSVTSLSMENLGGDRSKDRRLNPAMAAIMSTLTTLRTFGAKRLMIVGGGVVAILLLAVIFGGERKHRSRIKVIKARAVEAGISTEGDMKKRGTPQYHALSWLANVDGTSLDSPFLMQRYALAVLFYSTSGTSEHVKPVGRWKIQDNWMSKKGFCSWHGITCAAVTAGADKDGEVTSVVLSSNELSGNLPEELVGLEDLITLDLYDNLIGGTLPSSLSKLEKLNFLLLGANGFTGKIPEAYESDFINLRDFDVSYNQITGEIPTGMLQLKNIRKVGFEHNQLTGDIPDINGFEGITHLYLQGNSIEGIIPGSLAMLSSLIDLRLSGNKLEGPIPREFRKLTKLEYLHASDMSISGNFPTHIGSLTRLLELKLANNTLDSTLPDYFSSLGDLRVLDISRNKLTGVLPPQIAAMTDMQVLNVEFNQFAGEIPDLDTMKDLEILGLRKNQFVGTIPRSLGSCHKLKEVLLASNQLTGTVPSEIGALTELGVFTLEHNGLSGAVPQRVCDLNANEKLYFFQTDCKSGGITCSCCTDCF